MRTVLLFFILLNSLLPLSLHSHAYLSPPDPSVVHIPYSIPAATTKQKLSQKYPEELVVHQNFRSLADWVFDAESTTFPVWNIKKADRIYIERGFVPLFYHSILPHLPYPVIIITLGDSRDVYLKEGVDELTKLAEHPNVIHVFVSQVSMQHPKVTLLPLGVCPFLKESHGMLMESWRQRLTTKQYFRNKPLHAFYHAGHNHSYRTTLRDLYSHEYFNWIHMLQKSTRYRSIGFNQFFYLMVKSKFVISPRGFRLDNYRTWEALYAGSIPVIEGLGMNELFEGLPVIIVDDLKTVTKEKLEKAYQELRKKKLSLKKLNLSYWKQRIQNIQDKYKNAQVNELN